MENAISISLGFYLKIDLPASFFIFLNKMLAILKRFERILVE